MRDVDLSVVTYQPDFAQLRTLFASLADSQGTGSPDANPPARLHLFLRDNSPDPTILERLRALPELQPGGAFATVDVQHSGSNVGFGRAHNASFERASHPWFFVLNPDCELEPGALAVLLATAEADDARVAAWEMRQIPYEHPKAYDPVTLETHWVSGAAALFRREAFAEAGGYDARIFLYGEDVDLSWRLRARGWTLRYVPKAGVVHRTYAEANEVKPMQVFGSVFANLALRLRYGGPHRVMQGLAMLFAEITGPRSFTGRRRGLFKAGLRFLRHAPHFFMTRVKPTATFRPEFNGWSYELRREGAFHPLRSQREVPAPPQPRVSILIRTVNRQAWLREALTSCANQTYANLEVVVIEDGPEASRSVVEAFASRLDLKYQATGERTGRAHAGNLAMAAATGEWLNFLDDDDVLFADHVEVLVDAVQQGHVKGAYSLAWETFTDVHDREVARYAEVNHVTRHQQAFDRLTLWHHNYLPIQAVLFHRSLYERHGGFAEDMDQLEDWNLWTRYTLEDDFVLVGKTTSKYRVPADPNVAADRQGLLDHAYADALERQRAMRMTLSPRQVSEMAELYLRSQSVVMVTRRDVLNFMSANRVLAGVARLRHPARDFLRRRGFLR